MALAKVMTDQKTRDKLGAEGLAELSRCLWPVDCQSCGRPLGDETPALYVNDLIVYATASLHHPRCQPAQWQDAGMVQLDSSAAMLSFTSRLVMLPIARGDRPDPRPMLLVNPGLEMVLIEPDEQQRWRVRPPAEFTAAGLVPPGPRFVVDQPIPGAVARLTRDSIAVTIQSPSGSTFENHMVFPTDDPFVTRIRELGGVLLGITHALNPHQVSAQELDHAMRSGQLLLGWVALHGVKTATRGQERPLEGPSRTYVLLRGLRHMTVGPVLGHTAKNLTAKKAWAWARGAIGVPTGQPLQWEPVDPDNAADDTWRTLNVLSLKQYLLCRHPDGWRLIEALSYVDGPPDVETDNEAKAWAAGVLQFKAHLGPPTWEPGPTSPGTSTFYATASLPTAPEDIHDEAADEAADEAEPKAYTDALLEKLSTQESYSVNVADEVIQLAGGRSGFQQWITNLWPGACQTCGEPLGTKAEVSADGPTSDDEVLISLHHSTCRPSSITPPDGTRLRRASSVCVVSYLGEFDNPTKNDFPIMVVNPSCEQLIVKRGRLGRWRNATLDDFANLGFAKPNTQFPPTVSSVRAQLHEDRVIVSVSSGRLGGHTWSAPVPQSVRPALHHTNGLAVSVITKTIPSRLAFDELPASFNDPEALIAWVPLTDQPTQT